jgi:hypothetical protein
MNKIVDLERYRSQVLKQRYFGAWEERFGEEFALSDRLTDISDQSLYRLACPGDDSNQAFYEVIMGTLELGPAAKFGYLEDDDKLRVVNVHLFLVDMVRFELMRRLGWLCHYAAFNECIVELVHRSEDIKTRCRNQGPELVPTHPKYNDYCMLVPRDKDAFVRSLLTDALEAFKRRV